MTATPASRLMTAEELARLPEDGRRYELVHGKLIRMSPSSIRPSAVVGKMMFRLSTFVERRKLGVYGSGEGGFRLASEPDTVRAPDVWFLRAERVPVGGLPDGFFPGAPDLAVEVLSPTDRFVDVLQKVEDYLRAGTQLVWVIDPEGRSAGVFRPGGMPSLLGEDGVLDGEGVVPGFTVALRELLP